MNYILWNKGKAIPYRSRNTEYFFRYSVLIFRIFRDGHISCHSTLSFWDTKYNIMYHTVQSSWSSFSISTPYHLFHFTKLSFRRGGNFHESQLRYCREKIENIGDRVKIPVVSGNEKLINETYYAMAFDSEMLFRKQLFTFLFFSGFQRIQDFLYLW